MELQLVTRTCGDFVVVAAHGEVDAATSDQLCSFLLNSRERVKRGIVVDLAHVDFMDCSGLRALVSAQRDAALLGGELRLAAPQPSVARVLGLSDLYRLLPPFPSVDAAVAAPSGIRIVADVLPAS